MNCLQNDAAIEFQRYIKDRQPYARIVIPCYYSATVKAIEKSEPDVEVYSINKYQRQKCDYSIIITTRVLPSGRKKNVKFVLDPHRATVALSRAREGVVIIGDNDVLCKSPVWTAFFLQVPECFM